MKIKTKFEKLVKELSETSKLFGQEILHLQVQTAVKMYRFLTKDLEALDIVIKKDGKIVLYRSGNLINISKKVRQLIVWAVYRSMENKIFPNFKIN